MDALRMQPPLGGRWLLPFGDAVIYVLLTVFGFALHQEIEAAASGRFLATYLPFLGAWFAAAGALGALDPERAVDPRQVWRPAVGALLAAPLGAVLRGACLGTPVVPVFVAVMGAMSLVGLLLWRAAYLLLRRRRSF